MVMADPLDHGHGKNIHFKLFILGVLWVMGLPLKTPWLPICVVILWDSELETHLDENRIFLKSLPK